MPTRRHSPSLKKKLSPAAFKALQDRWYKKLADAGFEDAEDTSHKDRPLKTWHSLRLCTSNEDCRSRPRHRLHTPETIRLTQTYYEQAEHMLNVYPFENDTHKRIWELHASGLSDYEIAKVITNMTPTYSRRWVNHIVRMLALQVRVS